MAEQVKAHDHWAQSPKTHSVGRRELTPEAPLTQGAMHVDKLKTTESWGVARWQRAVPAGVTGPGFHSQHCETK